MMNAVFSSEKDVEAFTKEQKNEEEALKPFIEICYERKIIAEKKSTKFLSFINQGQKEVGNNFSQLTFKDFIESRDKYLDSSGTVAELCEEINALTEALGLQPSLGNYPSCFDPR